MKTIVATEPFQKVAADIIEIPITSRGNRYVLVVQDYFSKYVNLYAIPDQCSTTVAKCLFEDLKGNCHVRGAKGGPRYRTSKQT